MELFSDVAPWYIVPANKKWYRNLAITEALVELLGRHREAWRAKLKAMSEQGMAELQEYRRGLD